MKEVEAYLLHLVKDRQLSYSTMNQAACAARFLYERVLGHSRELFHIPMARNPAKQPEPLAREEIARLLAVCSHPLRRMLLQTIYATGLRVSEACALRVSDIDSHSDRMCVRVACGKGGHARYTILSPTLLGLLRTYVRGFRPCTWLFGNASGTQPMSIEMAQRAYQGARQRAGITKTGGIHTLRHCFAHPLARRWGGPVHDPETAGPRPHQHHRALPAPDQPTVSPAQRHRPAGPAGRPSPAVDHAARGSCLWPPWPMRCASMARRIWQSTL